MSKVVVKRAKAVALAVAPGRTDDPEWFTLEFDDRRYWDHQEFWDSWHAVCQTPGREEFIEKHEKDWPEHYTERYASVGGRVQWASDLSSVWDLSDDTYDFSQATLLVYDSDDEMTTCEPGAKEDELDWQVTYSVYGALEDIDSKAEDDIKVFNLISFFHQFLWTVDDEARKRSEQTTDEEEEDTFLDDMFTRSADSEPLASVLDTPEKTAQAKEAIFAKLGRVFAFSDFHCTLESLER